MAILGVQTFKEVSPFSNSLSVIILKDLLTDYYGYNISKSQLSQHPSGFIDPFSSPTAINHQSLTTAARPGVECTSPAPRVHSPNVRGTETFENRLIR